MSARITTENKKIVIKPLQQIKPGVPIFLNANKRIITLTGENSNELLLKNIKLSQAKNLFKEDVLYESQPGDFLKGHPHQKIIIINKLNIINSCSRTIAKFVDYSDKIIEKTSDAVVKIIGQENYDTLLSALCSVISQELKIRSILALLTSPGNSEEASCQTETDGASAKTNVETVEKDCQTDENSADLLFKIKPRKRIKRSQLTPYVVKDSPTEKVEKKVVINPNSYIDRQLIANVSEDSVKKKIETVENFNSDKKLVIDLKNSNIFDVNPELKSQEENNDKVTYTTGLSDFKDIVLEESCDSIGNLSLSSNMGGLIHNAHEIFKQVDQRTVNANQPSHSEPKYFLTLPDNSRIMIRSKPEDQFHIATPDILNNVTNEEKMKIVWFQATLDWKYCLTKDEDGYLPLHIAVMNTDLDLVRRQCLVLRNRGQSLDVTACNMTALQMALNQNSPGAVRCTEMLLQYGADPLFTDDDQRTVLHLAAEGSPDHLKAVINYCRNNAREILQDQEEMWSQSLNDKPKEYLAEYLLDRMCKMANGQGYTPLMVAARLGHHANVALLVEASSRSVNVRSPNSGSTALYLAVGAACIDAGARGNKSTVAENFSRTISILITNGADAYIKNLSGSDVNELLTEFNIPELSLLIANGLASIKVFDGKPLDSKKNCSNYILKKETDGTVMIKELEKKKNLKEPKRDSTKPVILENTKLDKMIQPVVVTALTTLSPKDKMPIKRAEAPKVIKSATSPNLVSLTSKIAPKQIVTQNALKRKLEMASPRSKKAKSLLKN